MERRLPVGAASVVPMLTISKSDRGRSTLAPSHVS